MIDIEHEDTVLRTFILFIQTARSVLKYADTHLYRKTRLSTIKFIVLRALASNNGVMRPSEIAEWTHTERHNITALIDRMRQEGLVTSERNTSDKRLVNVTLTDKGMAVLSLAMPEAKEVVDQVMLSIAEVDQNPPSDNKFLGAWGFGSAVNLAKPLSGGTRGHVFRSVGHLRHSAASPALKRVMPPYWVVA